MKKCKCGKEIDDRWDLCYECNEKAKATRETPNERQESIERQVAAKCTAQVYEGHDPMPGYITEKFNHFLKLIRNE